MTADVLPANRAHQWGGLFFAVGNVLFLANKFDEMSRLFLGRRMPDVISGQNPGLILLGQVCLIIGFAGYYRYYAQGAGRADKMALRLLCGGGILMAIGHVTFMSALGDYLSPTIFSYLEPIFLLVFIGVLGLVIGLIWFGILNLRHPILNHPILNQWRWLPLFTGVMGFTGFFLTSGEEITALFLFFRTLFALGLVGLGIILWLEPSRLVETI